MTMMITINIYDRYNINKYRELDEWPVARDETT